MRRLVPIALIVVGLGFVIIGLLAGLFYLGLPVVSPDAQFDLLQINTCLLYTSDAADERSSVDLGGRRIIKKKKHENELDSAVQDQNTTSTDKKYTKSIQDIGT